MKNVSRLLKSVACLAVIVFPFSSLQAVTVEDHFLHSNESPIADLMVSPMLAFNPFAAQEIGVKVSGQLLDDGFLEKLNDSVSVEGSLFYGEWDFDDSAKSWYFSANMRWDFHLHPDWTVFGAPGLSRRINKYGRDTGVRPSVQIGGFWNIQPDLALRADLDVEDLNPRVGLSFRM